MRMPSLTFPSPSFLARSMLSTSRNTFTRFPSLRRTGAPRLVGSVGVAGFLVAMIGNEEGPRMRADLEIIPRRAGAVGQ